MSSISYFFVAALAGLLGMVVAAFVFASYGEWFQISNREGAAGYMMILVALVSGVAAFVLSLVLSRVVSGMANPGFFKALGMSLGGVLAIAGIALLFGWVRADFSPKIDGRSLELAIEVRAPKDFTLPTEEDQYGAYACVRVPGSGRYEQQGKLDLAHAKKVDGHWMVTAVVPLYTSSSNKVMDVRFSNDASLTFGLPLRSHPSGKDLEWSNWVDSAWDAGKPEPPKEQKFNLRYKVQLMKPPPAE